MGHKQLSAVITFPTSLIKSKDKPQTSTQLNSTQGRKISQGAGKQLCLTATQPNLEPQVGTRTSAKTFQQSSLYGAFPPAPCLLGAHAQNLSLSFSLQSHVAGSTLTWPAWAVLVGAFYSVSINFDSPSILSGRWVYYVMQISQTIPPPGCFPS